MRMGNQNALDASHLKRFRREGNSVCIDLKLKHAQQLFDARDPAPFRDRDLDDDAAEYIVAALQEVHWKGPIKLSIQFTNESPQSVHASSIESAIHTYFDFHSELLKIEIRENLKQGQVSLVIGLLFLVTCIYLSHSVDAAQLGLVSFMIKEGFIISGWVAMWRPLDLLLYSWLPLLKKRRIYQRLSKIPVEILFSQPNEI